MSGRITLSKEEIKALSKELFMLAGVPEEQADMTAESLADAEERGVETHGMRWMDIYLKRIQAGGVAAETKLEIIKDKGPVLIVDANHGLGQVATTMAIDMGIERAKKNGLCAVAIRNSNHFGAAGYYAERAANQGMICYICTNADALMAPWGGLDNVVGTSPLCYGFPTKTKPIIFDMAVSAIAKGKIFVAAREGKPIPPGCALNKYGEPTTDAKEALDGGYMLPAAGHKGFGLALVNDILAGIMTGSQFGTNITKLYGDLDKHQDIGHFAYLVNIEDFIPEEEYYDKIEFDMQKIKSSRLAKGFDRIYLPGEPEHETRAKRRAEGIPMSKEVWDEMLAWKEKLQK
nr:Ldh family oxidoreductase [Lachnospiraceae bacterium]